MARPDNGKANPWGGTAYLVEAMVLLAFLVAALAVCSALFAQSLSTAREQSRLERAVAVATDTAERFSADPSDPEGCIPDDTDGLDVACDVTPEQNAAGTLYEATITVSDGGQQVYTLTTARYVEGGAA